MAVNNYLEQIASQIDAITKSLNGAFAQLEALNRKIERSRIKVLWRTPRTVNENMRLIIEVIKKTTFERQRGVGKNEKTRR